MARATATFSAGRVWEFGRWPAAQSFLRRFAREETTAGEVGSRLRRLCPVCADGPAPPPPSARFVEGGWSAATWAKLGVPHVSVRAREDAVAVVGRRRAGGRETLYLRLGGDVTANLGAVVGSVSSARGAQALLELTSRDGRLVEARVRAEAEVAAEAELAGMTLDVGDVADRLRGAVGRTRAGGDGGGVAVEAQVALDLSDPANRRAVTGLLSPGRSPLDWVERTRALGRRLDVAGAVDLELVRTTRAVEDHGSGVGALVRLGAEYARTERTRELLAAWSLRAGGPLRRREDCEGPVRSPA